MSALIRVLERKIPEELELKLTKNKTVVMKVVATANDLYALERKSVRGSFPVFDVSDELKLMLFEWDEKQGEVLLVDEDRNAAKKMLIEIARSNASKKNKQDDD